MKAAARLQHVVITIMISITPVTATEQQINEAMHGPLQTASLFLCLPHQPPSSNNTSNGEVGATSGVNAQEPEEQQQLQCFQYSTAVQQC